MESPLQKDGDADAVRGIQNAVSRFKKQRQQGLTSEQLLQKAALSENAVSSSRPARKKKRLREHMDEQVRLIEDGLQFALPSGVAYEKGDAELLLKNPPIEPSFPGFMLGVALLKDILDFSDITGVGIVVTTALSFILALTVFIWLLGKLSGGWWKKKMIQWIWVRYVIMVCVEFVPFVKFIPATTILILMAHYRETEIVKLFNGALERFRKAGLPK